MKEGDIVLALLPQKDGRSKYRPLWAKGSVLGLTPARAR
jgi:hypothetical protein